ncbi:MAG: hypothetical protein U5R48_14900 [Gammaproteobacteria bacterium]|nr:hypothetical protein [Gammaproteobacteria bacterium]
MRTTDTALTLGAVELDAATTLVSGSGALTPSPASPAAIRR